MTSTNNRKQNSASETADIGSRCGESQKHQTKTLSPSPSPKPTNLQSPPFSQLWRKLAKEFNHENHRKR